MPCGSSSPIGTQIGAGIGTCQIILNLSTPKGEPELQLQRVINYLEGHKGEHYDSAAGGLSYIKDAKWPDLGQGIIRDLDRVARGGEPKLPLSKNEAAIALRVAEAARDVAVKGLADAKRLEQAKAIDKIKESAKIISSLLQVTLEVVLA